MNQQATTTTSPHTGNSVQVTAKQFVAASYVAAKGMSQANADKAVNVRLSQAEMAKADLSYETIRKDIKFARTQIE